MKKFLLMLTAAFMVMSCSQDKLAPSLTTEIETLKSELISVAEQNSQVIDYRAARYLAFEELESGAKSFLGISSSDYTLSQIPRVVYESNGLPEFYEFDVFDKSYIHTIVTIAQKTDNTLIVDLYEGGKPDICATKSTDNYSHELVTGWEDYEALLPKMDEESRRMTLESIEQLKNYNELMDDDSSIDENELNSYWNDMEDKLGDLSNYEAKNLCLPMTKGDGVQPNAGDLYGTNPGSYYIIPKYNTGLKATHWDVECGAAAVAWVYRGLYDSYPKNSDGYIPIYGDDFDSENFTNYHIYDHYPNLYSYYTDAPNIEQADHGLYLQIKKHVHSLGEMYEAGLKNSMSEITGGAYKVSVTAYSHKHIQKDEPVIVMAVMDGSSHYFVAFGYGFIKKGTKKTKYIMIADNGVMTKYNTHRTYNAFWHKETSNYGLRYKVTKK